MLTYEEVVRRLLRALTTHKAETGLDLKAENFELHVHRDDWLEMVASVQAAPPYRPTRLDRFDVAGFKPVIDNTVPVGAPKLVCMWECTI